VTPEGTAKVDSAFPSTTGLFATNLRHNEPFPNLVQPSWPSVTRAFREVRRLAQRGGTLATARASATGSPQHEAQRDQPSVLRGRHRSTWTAWRRVPFGDAGVACGS